MKKEEKKEENAWVTSDGYALDFVNEGKPFIFPKWTIDMHEAAMLNMIKENPEATDEEKESGFRYHVLLESLKQVDEEVKLEDVKDLHPENLVVLFNAAYTSGKRDIYFRKG
jgi:hypothetical protein